MMAGTRHPPVVSILAPARRASYPPIDWREEVDVSILAPARRASPPWPTCTMNGSGFNSRPRTEGIRKYFAPLNPDL